MGRTGSERESMCVSVRVCVRAGAYAKGRKTVINFHHLTKTKLQDSVSKSWGKCFSIIHEYRHVCYQPLGPDVFRLRVGGKVQRGRALGDQQADSGGSCHVAAQKKALDGFRKDKSLFPGIWERKKNKKQPYTVS